MLKNSEFQLDRSEAGREPLVETGARARTARILSFYTRIMPRVIDVERCSVFIHDAGRDKVWLKAGTGVGEHEIEVPTRGSVVGDVIASGEPVIVSELAARPGAHKGTDEKTGFVTRNVLCVPITSPIRKQVTGAFQFLNKLDDREFTEEDMSLALEAAEHLQTEVDDIFLGQEPAGLGERFSSAARKTMTFLIVSVVVIFLVSFLALLGSGFLFRFLA